MTTLGGSTLPAACGLDPYCSPIRLWLRLTGRERVEETEAMWWGRHDEAAIVTRLMALGYELAYPGPEIADGWLVGHLDALFPDGPVECKSMAHHVDSLDHAHEAQLLTYMHLTGADRGLLARRVGHTLEVREVERRQPWIDLLLELGERFLGYVERDTPPPVSGHPDDRGALVVLFPAEARDEPIRETRAVREARQELRRLMEAEKARKERMEGLRALICEHMGRADTLIDRDGAPVATWRSVQSRRFNLDRFKVDHAALYEEYREPSTTRTLRLT